MFTIIGGDGGDLLDGGAGTDTLNLKLTAASTVNDLFNFEVVNVAGSASLSFMSRLVSGRHLLTAVSRLPTRSVFAIPWSSDARETNASEMASVARPNAPNIGRMSTGCGVGMDAFGSPIGAQAIAVDPRALLRILHSEAGANTLISLRLDGTDTKVLVKDFQLDYAIKTLARLGGKSAPAAAATLSM